MKRTRRLLSLVALASAVSLLGAACGDDKDDASTDSGSDSTEQSSDIKVGLAFDLAGRGDKSFNDSAVTGVKKAEKDLGITYKSLEPKTAEDRSKNLSLLVEAGGNPVVAVGFAFAEDLAKIAPENPDTTFAVVDGVVEEDKRADAALRRRRQQASHGQAMAQVGGAGGDDGGGRLVHGSFVAQNVSPR